jgi:FtsP/CotA-like multicopper oxidase with cupredoxin domain
MTTIHRSWRTGAALLLLGALMTACAPDDAMSPTGGGLVITGDSTGTAAMSKIAAHGGPAVDLGSCDSLAAPAGSKLAAHTFASGVQIYRWTGASWSFVAPEATLSANANGTGVIGTHFVGPTWQSNSGSAVKGTVAKRCTPDAASIAWLSLNAVADNGPGLFSRVMFIQRVNTVGGLAPSAPGTTVGELAKVPYTAEYFFYREQ